MATVDPVVIGGNRDGSDNSPMLFRHAPGRFRSVSRLAALVAGVVTLSLTLDAAAQSRELIVPAAGAETAAISTSASSLDSPSRRVTLPSSSPVRTSTESVRIDPAEIVWAALRQKGVLPQDYGLVVRPLDGKGLALKHNADLPFNPASTMKLVTTHAAIGLLGADYRWITGLYTTGVVEDGVLNGDLIIKGGGDPKLVIEDMTELVTKLRAGGLRDIRGNLIIDDAIYGVGAERQPSFDGDDNQPYNVQPYAALMNFKATRFTINPRNRQVTMDPPLADVRVVNDVKVLNGRCRRAATGFTIDDDSTESRAILRVRGSMVGACGPQNFYAAALSHRQYVHGFFKAAWLGAGGTLTGTTKIVQGAARGEPYYEWQSPRTLADIVRDINKFSNNVMARMLVLQMGAESRTQPASVRDGRTVLRDWYASRNLKLASLVIENGSGLSRSERISASDLTDILVDAARGPDAWLFEDSLPSVGVDGTMRRRMRNDPLAGNAHIKTGTLRNVRAIAGYVTAASGRRYALTLIINGPHAEGSAPAQDALLRWVYQNG